jgi:hypothetical protein
MGIESQGDSPSAEEAVPLALFARDGRTAWSLGPRDRGGDADRCPGYVYLGLLLGRFVVLRRVVPGRRGRRRHLVGRGRWRWRWRRRRRQLGAGWRGLRRGGTWRRSRGRRAARVLRVRFGSRTGPEQYDERCDGDAEAKDDEHEFRRVRAAPRLGRDPERQIREGRLGRGVWREPFRAGAEAGREVGSLRFLGVGGRHG